METLDYYKLIRNSVQLFDVELISMNCNTKKLGETDKELQIPMILQRSVNIVSDKEAEIFLRTQLGSKDGPFFFDIVYRGVCVAFVELGKEQFEQYTFNQIVPLLLPYVRECVASTMARMGLPIYTIPTMDVLDSIEANFPPNDGQE